jgi:hypothetical protein
MTEWFLWAPVLGSLLGPLVRYLNSCPRPSSTELSRYHRPTYREFEYTRFIVR